MPSLEVIQQFVQDQLANNDFLSGGVVIVILTAALTYVRSVPRRAWDLLNQWSHTTLVVRNDNGGWNYTHLLDWLTANDKIMFRNRTLQFDKSKLVFGIGSSWFFRGWRFIRVYRAREENSHTGQLESRETLTLRAWGRNSRVLQDVIDEAVALSEGDGVRHHVNVYNTCGFEWNYIGEIPKRPLDSIILKDNKLDMMVRRIESFRDNAKKYVELGVPHRLGFLLEGPTGTGKTSTILALASHFDAQLKIVSLTSLDDTTLMRLCGEMSSSEALRFIVFEDADVLFEGRESQNKSALACVTFGGLLNAIDGLTSGVNRVTFITTNHVEKLDPALLRPGRVDVRITLDNLDFKQACGMYKRFFDDDADTFALEFTGKSSAEAQEELIRRYFHVPVVSELATLCDLS